MAAGEAAGVAATAKLLPLLVLAALPARLEGRVVAGVTFSIFSLVMDFELLGRAAELGLSCTSPDLPLCSGC